MKLLIIGGTGGTGRQLVVQALEKGHSITVLARNPAKLKTQHPNLRIVKGNVLRFEELEQAVQGQDGVLCALGHKRFFIKTTILSRGTANLIRAMEQEGVKRLVIITSLGINDSRFRLGLYYTLFTVPLILYFYFRDKAKQERLVMQSELNWTIIRPGQLTNGRLKGQYRHGRGLGSYVLTKLISRADVAHFMLNEIENNNYVRAVAAITY